MNGTRAGIAEAGIALGGSLVGARCARNVELCSVRVTLRGLGRSLRGALFPEAPAISQLGRRELACGQWLREVTASSLPGSFNSLSQKVTMLRLIKREGILLSLSRRKQVSPGGSRVSGKTVGGQHTGAVLEVGDYGDSSSMVEWQWLREVTASSLPGSFNSLSQKVTIHH
jgi:hypothetical protein